MGLDGDEIEAQRDELRRQFPGWRIWAVPVGNPLTTHINWSAQPEPVINAGSAGELAARIRAAHSQPPGGSPSLATWRSYAARVRALRRHEEAVAAAWMRRRAEADARREALAADPVARFRARYRSLRQAGGEEMPAAGAAVSDGEPEPA